MKKNVAIISYSLSFGGAERFTAELSKALDGAGYNVCIFLINDRNIAYEYAGEIKKLCRFFGKKNNFLSTLFSFQYFLFAKRYKKKCKIDFCISVTEFPNLINLLASSGEKIIATQHNYKFQHEITPGFKENLLLRMFKKRINRIDKMITVSEKIKEKAEEIYGLSKEKIDCIYNSTNVEQIKKMSLNPPCKKAEEFLTHPTFINVARHEAQKSVNKLILAFSEVEKRHPEARLILIGEGSETEKLKELSRKIGVGEKVLFFGFMENPFPYVTRSRAFVLSSEYEGFGLVITEAMSCGCPVISTDCLSGPKEIISPNDLSETTEYRICEYGILTRPHNGENKYDKKDECTFALAQAMERIFEDDQLSETLKAQSKKRASDFTPEIIYGKWISLLEDL